MQLTDIPKIIRNIKIYEGNIKNINFDYIYTNSKNIKSLSIFAIKKNKNFKEIYLKEAIRKGSVAILSNYHFKNFNIPQFLVKNLNKSINLLLNKLFPIKPINSIGITGTNGKTSVVWLLSQLCFIENIPTKTYGTLGYFINGKKKSASNLTTPEFDVLHQTAYSKKKNFYNYIFEVSSHSLDQNRLKNFPVNIAAITNLTNDHLDYHKNFKNYKDSKFKLFLKYLDKNGIAILNDQIKGIKNLKKKLKNYKIITYGKNKSDINILKKNNKIEIKIFKKKYLLNINYSQIELENISCVIACCLCLKIKEKNILKNLRKIKNPPGRLELIQSKNKNFKIYVDYAHTPDALKKVLLSKTFKKRKPNVVFGCGGERDKDKRFKMGSIANKYANKIYITDDNPRNEDPSNIRSSILVNCKRGIEIASRKVAINRAIQDLNKNDILIIAGKGHEKIQIYKNKEKTFDDIKVANLALNKKIN